MVQHIQPIANILPLSIDRDMLLPQTLKQYHRDELLRELVRSVIVGAIGDENWQTVGVVPCSDKVIRRRFACGVWGARIVRSFLGKVPFDSEGPEDFVGRHVQKPKLGFLLLR
jgi:hypothetical protein